MKSLNCPSCHEKFSIEGDRPPLFCPFCSHPFKNSRPPSSNGDSVSFVQGHAPTSFEYMIGPYQVFQSIGKGGMGEVLLAYDTICGRKIALKRIRPDLLEFRNIQNRFLKEARLTSQLMHPAIIPIYSIHQEENAIYYTMPYVQGETLKQILRKARQAEKKGEKIEGLAQSIPALMRIFLSVCQAVAYAHSKSVLHRDLKPENIIIGEYGEVMILDWGLAKLMESSEEDEIEEATQKNQQITLLGKVVGTVGYMAPERALGEPASKKTDIYSLGSILYQILTLRVPFRRGTLKEFRENMTKEVLQDPLDAAPYRDIPKELVQITLKCLAKNTSERYSNIDELIEDIQNYIEGRAEWFKIAELSIQNKLDWEFQEHILIAEHAAITRSAENSDWVYLMVSKNAYAETLKIETKIFLQNDCQGVGFLLNVPEANERDHINDGYCLWLSNPSMQSSKLLLNSIEVLPLPDVSLKPNCWHTLRLEKIDQAIHFYLNGEEVLKYISRKPMLGTHIGFISRDLFFSIDPFQVYVSSQNILVNCLAIPDAFLAHKQYPQALSEYRRIAFSFAGRAEGREATLRAGITLLEQAKATGNAALYDQAIEEFEKLHRTPGAPFEYLGKALIYEAEQDIEEEIKCFELAYRRYPHHPLLSALEDQIIFRLMECSRKDRRGTYYFLLLALTKFPHALELMPIKRLTENLIKHWEQLPWIKPASLNDIDTLSVTLAFWLHKTYVLEEIFTKEMSQTEPNIELLLSILICFAELNEKDYLKELTTQFPSSSLAILEPYLSIILNPDIESAFDQLKSSQHTPLVLYLCDRALDEKKPELVLNFIKEYPNKELTPKQIWALLELKRWDEAGKLFENFTFDQLSQENSLFHYLYGCWLNRVEGAEIAFIHWSSVLNVPFPRTWTLGSHYLMGTLEESWFKNSFEWEKIQLKRLLALKDNLNDSK